MHRNHAFYVLIAVVMVACSSGGGGGFRAHSNLPHRPALVEAWRNASIKPIGQPVVAGDILVVYGTVGKDLRLYGVAPADGTVRWDRQATPSDTTSGIALTPSVIDGHVAYFRPDLKANLAARLVVADSPTGRDLLVSEPMIFRSHPGHCPDGKDICAGASDASGTTTYQRFSIDAAGPVPDRAAPPADSRFVGHELLDLGQRQPELLAGFQNGSVTWRYPLTRYFSPGYTTDYGWYFRFYKQAGLQVGSVDRPPDESDTTHVARDLAKAQTSAFDNATGAPAWRSDGTSLACDSKVDLDRTLGDGRSEPWPVRCRYRGTLRYDRATRATTYEGLDVTMEGFDVATGNTTWSLPLGAAEAFMAEEIDAISVSGSEMLVQGAAGPLIVDVGTGVARVPEKGEAVWCPKNVFFDFREGRRSRDGSTNYSWRGGTLLDACAADRSPTTAVPSNVPTSVGAKVGERAAVATAHGLVAYDHTGR